MVFSDLNASLYKNIFFQILQEQRGEFVQSFTNVFNSLVLHAVKLLLKQKSIATFLKLNYDFIYLARDSNI